MNSNILDTLLLVATYIIWLAMPLLPAVLIYKLFPDTPVSLRGPFHALTISAGGAFAAYFITLIASVLFVRSIYAEIRNPPNSLWRLSGTLAVKDEHGNKQDVPQKGIVVSVEPSPFVVTGDALKVDIWKYRSEWPTIRIDVPSYGAKTFTLDPSKMNFDVDDDNYLIKIHDPIIVRKPYSVAAGNAADIAKLDGLRK